MPGFEELWFNKRDVLLQEAENVVSKALRKAGWQHTSQTVCSVWMWQKEIAGRLYSVSQERAAEIEEHLQRREYFERFPEELSD